MTPHPAILQAKSMGMWLSKERVALKKKKTPVKLVPIQKNGYVYWEYPARVCPNAPRLDGLVGVLDSIEELKLE